MSKKARKIVFLIALFLLLCIVVVLVATTIRFLAYRPYVIDGDSMLPTYSHGELVYINTVKDVQRNDIVAIYCAPFGSNAKPYEEIYSFNNFLRAIPVIGGHIKSTTELGGFIPLIKRVVALPGDTVELKAETVDSVNHVFLYVNDERAEDVRIMLNKNALDEATRAFGIANPDCDLVIPTQKYTVPEGEIYVLGDNRDGSTDSRALGSIPLEYLIGVVR